MSRKTPFDREANLPDAEATGEAGGYLNGIRQWLGRILERHPKTAYALMVAVLSGSVAFALLTPRGKPHHPDSAPLEATRHVSGGLGDMLSKAGALRELLELQTLINAMANTDSLGAADSLLLENALDRLHEIESRISEPNEPLPKDNHP